MTISGWTRPAFLMQGAVMRCTALLVLLACCHLTACGGSASETPMPQEPLPHAGPEPTDPGQLPHPPATGASGDEQPPPLSSRE